MTRSDVDETTGCSQPRTELADIQLAFSVSLREAEECDVQAATIVKVELVWLIDHSLGIGGRSEVKATSRKATDD